MQVMLVQRVLSHLESRRVFRDLKTVYLYALWDIYHYLHFFSIIILRIPYMGGVLFRILYRMEN